jgi:hypothetical protein
MKNNHVNATRMSIRALLFAVVSSYVFPAAMSWVSGWLLNDAELQKASITTIAIPSCIAAFFSFILLWQMQLHQITLVNKMIRTATLVVIMSCASALIAWGTGFQSEIWNIVLSSAIGAAITTWRQPMFTQEN